MVTYGSEPQSYQPYYGDIVHGAQAEIIWEGSVAGSNTISNLPITDYKYLYVLTLNQGHFSTAVLDCSLLGNTQYHSNHNSFQTDIKQLALGNFFFILRENSLYFSTTIIYSSASAVPNYSGLVVRKIVGVK
jgi:hypothetical protein